MTLNFKHRLFLKHLFDGAKDDPVKAAAMAGFTNPKQAASRLLANRTIAAYVEQKLEESGAMGVSEVLARWTDTASFDPTEFLVFTEEEKNGKKTEKVAFDVKKLKRRGLGHLIKKIEIRPGGHPLIEFHSSMEAQDKLAKYHGMFTQKIEIEHLNGEASSERVNLLVNIITQQPGAIAVRDSAGEIQSSEFRDACERGEMEIIPSLEVSEPTPPVG